MAVPVIMPRQGQSVESCIISKWHKKKGDTIKKGEVIFSYETDKAGFEEESTLDGIVLDIFFDEGDDVDCLINVCVIGQEGESTSEFDPRKNEVSKEVLTESANKKIEENDNKIVEVEKEVEISKTDIGKIFISPRAKKYSRKVNIDFSNIIGTGANGRIIENDIIKSIESGRLYTKTSRDLIDSHKSYTDSEGTAIGGRIATYDIENAKEEKSSVNIESNNDYEIEKFSNIRKVIAKTMSNSLSNMAQLTLNTSFDATEIMNLRNKVKGDLENTKDSGLGIENITLNDMIIFALIKTLTKHKRLNAHLKGDELHLYNSVNMGVAIDTERGLMVPTIVNSNKKSLNQISKEIKELALKCKEGTINPDVLKGGTFTITNLGIYNIENFTPVINPPQVAILGVGSIVKKPKEENNKLVLYSSIGLSLTFDHQAIDGAPAARFLNDLKTNLENFQLLLLKN
ncbi:MAG: dihydrolipoamide acetyltransferase family protein [Clostridiales bacterium]